MVHIRIMNSNLRISYIYFNILLTLIYNIYMINFDSYYLNIQ